MDLDMPEGKGASMASHASANSLIQYLARNPHRLQEFADAGNSGSRVTLKAKNQFALERALAEAQAAGLPCYLMIDSGHILPPHFLGQPVVTALGIGPCTKEQARPIVKRFQCL